jgi:hypothetical protein
MLVIARSTSNGQGEIGLGMKTNEQGESYEIAL